MCHRNEITKDRHRDVAHQSGKTVSRFIVKELVFISCALKKALFGRR